MNSNAIYTAEEAYADFPSQLTMQLWVEVPFSGDDYLSTFPVEVLDMEAFFKFAGYTINAELEEGLATYEVYNYVALENFCNELLNSMVEDIVACEEYPEFLGLA